ncbi:MAG: hypothetical protein WD045_04990 [Pirellulaceae bacterium]
MAEVSLIHPIYLDVPMLVSFAAATQGGLSFGSEITKETKQSSSTDTKISGKMGISNLFSSLFAASVIADASSERSDEGKQLRRESKAHTEASIAILLYDHLRKEDGYLLKRDKGVAFSMIEAGSLVELSGVLKKNAIDAVIDYLDAVNILSSLDTSQPAPTRSGSKGNGRNRQAEPAGLNRQLSQMRKAFDDDRKRTPISNTLLECDDPADFNAVITLRTEYLRDLTLSELHNNSVRVVGKVTRVVSKGDSISAFENYGMALLNPVVLREAFDKIASSEDIVADFTDVVVAGPCIQVLPLMVFV